MAAKNDHGDAKRLGRGKNRRNLDPNWGRKPRKTPARSTPWRDAPLKTYEKVRACQRLLIQKSQTCDESLRSVRQAMARIQGDELMIRLLCEEQLDNAPACLLGVPDDLISSLHGGRRLTVSKLQIFSLELKTLLPACPIEPAVKQTDWYREIADSITAYGQIEPITVRPQSAHGDGYVILDGRLRREALLECGATQADCWVTGDSACSVNSHRHRKPTPILEHFMICRALDRGVSRADLATALGYCRMAISRKRDLLNGVCEEARDLMSVHRMNQQAIHQLRLVRGPRQVRMVELIEATNNYSAAYAKCLLGATPQEQLVDSDASKSIEGLNPAQIANLESEREPFESNFLQAFATYGATTLQLAVLMGYARVLFANSRVQVELASNHPEIRTDLEKLFLAYGPFSRYS